MQPPYSVLSTTIVDVPASLQAKIGDTTEINILFYPYDKQNNASITIVDIDNRLRPRLLTATTNFTNTTDLDTASVWKNRIDADVVEGYGLSLKLLNVNYEDNGRYEVTIKTNSNQTHHFQLLIEAVAPPAFVSISIPKPKGPVFTEFEPVNITCSGAAGRPLGRVYLSRLTKGSKVYQILDIPPVMHNYTAVNNGSFMIHYTFERVLRADDDQARYACEIHPGSEYFGSVYLTRSPLELLKVDYCTKIIDSPLHSQGKVRRESSEALKRVGVENPVEQGRIYAIPPIHLNHYKTFN
ncbi:hypothetical protein LOTGIDRAFT_153274 [Lottia gigantea]|uniref:Immunoglobulin domain-containing protein n=1 Tax=Lottia gigantea TaxID=225164 RepID=V3ZQV6_LOTGI|nr:hypothetical protein LOTGIDRAFT_153274 [Lottia gigantea]ESO93803.1 hypothetical protein LOTGIDRAFT_153274 [Lottia gigantea]